MTTRLSLFAVVALLLAAPTASAKGIASVTACGADRCRDAATGDAMRDHEFLQGGRPAARPVDGAPFFRVVVGLMSGPEQGDVVWRETLWVPSLRRAAERDALSGRLRWVAPTPSLAAALRRAVVGLEALPAAALARTVELGPRRAVAPPPPGPIARPAPAPAAPARTGDGGGLTGAIVLAGLAAVALAGTAGATRRRRRRPPEPAAV